MHAMQTVTMLLVALTLASGVNPTTGLATDWTRAGQTRVPPLYPYQDLPGVKAQPDKTEKWNGAQKRTRTSTPFRVPAPEAGASTNSAIWATESHVRGWLCCQQGF
jgi:hypothetical protein